ncbi:MAG: 5,6-dimethylbenzimidazole synthase [Nitrospina sp.]|jgi:5,6-dimethylbenzimidazole synthase|nr:5,6-dimethylbenzimidazole synthase [Nitrospina sp.]
MSNKTTLVTGGSRSGKSRHALEMSQKYNKKYFLATAEPLDEEMQERINRHQAERGQDWVTLEESLNVTEILEKNTNQYDVLILDCVTLWLSNLIMKGANREAILSKLHNFIEECKKSQGHIIVITNELGSGIIPMEASVRAFRDVAGEANQILASEFDEVINMVSGIPVVIKSVDSTNNDKLKPESSDHAFSSQKKQGLYEAIYKRRDIRHFNSKKIDPATLGRVLDAAHHAGSVGYMQPWNFVIIDDPQIKNKVAENFKKANEQAAQKFSNERKDLYNSLKLEGIEDAAINICVTCDRNRFGPNVLGRNTVIDTDIFSTCCAVQNLWLAARAEGLAVGWVSILSYDQLKDDLDIPDHVQPVAYLCIGHTEAFYKKPMLETKGWAKRLPVEKLISYNKWEGQPEDFKVLFEEYLPE